MTRKTSPAPRPSALHAPHRRGLGLALVALCLVGSGCGGKGGDTTGGGGPTDPGGGGGPTAPPANLSYSGGSLFLVVGTPLAPVAPSVDGVATSFSITPALPPGVTLDPVSGILAGTPTKRAPRTRYSVTAGNVLGQTTGSVDVEIAGPTRFAYATNSGDDTLSIYAVDADTGRLFFHGYHAQPAGQLGPGPVAVHHDGLAAYVANETSNSLSVHRLSTSTGRVSSTSVHPLGAGPHGLALMDAANYLYVSSEGAGTIAGFAVQADGTLISLGMPLATGSAPSQVLADPMCRFLVALNESANTVTSYLVNAANGALTASGTWSLGTGTLSGAVLSPSGRALYVTLEGSDRIVHFAVDPATGQLQEGTSLPTAGDPAPPTIHPSGKRVYVPDLLAGNLSRYAVDPNDGELSNEGSTIATTGANHVAFDDVGQYAYSVNAAGNVLMSFRYDSQTGELSELGARRTRQVPADLAFAAGDTPLRARATHAYVTNHASGSVWIFPIDATTGQLSNALTATTGAGPIDVALDPLGRYAFSITDTTKQLQAFTVQPNGGLASVGSPLSLPGVPTSVTVDPSGRWAFVTDVTSNQVRRYAVASSPTPGPVLTFLDAQPVGTYPIAVATDPTGQMLYVVNRDGNGSISQFTIHPQTGAVTAIQNAVAIAHPSSITFAPSGARAYSTLSTGHIVLPYDLDAHTGELDYVAPGTRALPLPFDVEISASGRFCYTVMYDTTQPAAPSGLSVFDVRQADGALWNSDSGDLVPTGGLITGLHPIDVASSPDERFAYVVNEGDNNVAVLAIDAQDGQLSNVQNKLTAMSPRSIDLAIRFE